MPTISGPLKLVTDKPAAVSRVYVRSEKIHPHATGIVIDDNDTVAVTNGTVSFNCLPGAAVLILVQNGVPQRPVPMLVGAGAAQSLAEVVTAARLADGEEKSELEELAESVALQIVQAGVEADRAKGEADRAAAMLAVKADKSYVDGELAKKANSSHVHTIADVTNLQSTLNGKAATSHTHTIANVTGLQAALDGKAASTHTHTIAQVSGLQAALDSKATAASFPPNTVTVETEQQATALTGLRKGDVVIVTQTGNIYKEV